MDLKLIFWLFWTLGTGTKAAFLILANFKDFGVLRTNAADFVALLTLSLLSKL